VDALANVNGVILPLAEATVPALDRGFLFGDAVYEVLRVYDGRPWLAHEHYERLARSLEAIRINGVDIARLRARMSATIAAGQFGEATVYIQVTRGAAPRTHVFPTAATPLEFLYVAAYHDRHRDDRQAGIAVVTYPDIRWDRCDIKSTNLLGNVLANQAASEAGCREALLYLPDGTLTEGSHTSFFAVRDGTVLTAATSSAILPGITRGLILRLTRQAGLSVREEVLRRSELDSVSELFLTGTTVEVLPVVRVDGRPVAEGRPGPVTRRLQQAYTDAVREFLKG
jgi:D-alanine transaminase